MSPHARGGLGRNGREVLRITDRRTFQVVEVGVGLHLFVKLSGTQFLLLKGLSMPFLRAQRRSLRVLPLAMLIACAAHAQTPTRQALNLPAGPLDQTLTPVARQAGVQVV